MASGTRPTSKLAAAAVRIDIAGSTTELVGEQVGVSKAELESVAPRLGEALQRLEKEQGEGRRPFLDQAGATARVAAIAAEVRDRSRAFDRVVVLGGEGAELGARLLVEAVPRGDNAPTIEFVRGGDPGQLRDLLCSGPIDRTFFHVVSGAGDSLELLASFLILRDALVRSLGAVDYLDHLLVSTDGDAGPLRQIVTDEGIHSSVCPAGVLGHQGASSPVHLLGAAIAGIDLGDYLAGVAAMDERCSRPDPNENPAAQLAAYSYLLATLHGVQSSVLFLQHPALAALGEWWRHFWSAGIGKQKEGETSAVAVGMMPAVACAPLDQYTLLQMLVDGPADKMVTFVRVAEDGGRAVELPRTYPDVDQIGSLGGQTLLDLSRRTGLAVECALARAERPTVAIELPARTPHAIGQLVRLLERTTLLAASLHGVDPQPRPGASAARRLAWGAMGLPGYEAEAREVEAWAASRTARILA